MMEKLVSTGKNMFFYYWGTRLNKIVFTDKIYVSTRGKFVSIGRKKIFCWLKYVSTIGETSFDRQKYYF